MVYFVSFVNFGLAKIVCVVSIKCITGHSQHCWKNCSDEKKLKANNENEKKTLQQHTSCTIFLYPLLTLGSYNFSCSFSLYALAKIVASNLADLREHSCFPRTHTQYIPKTFDGILPVYRSVPLMPHFVANKRMNIYSKDIE